MTGSLVERIIDCEGTTTEGEPCPLTVCSPVALRALLSPMEKPPTRGWLCIQTKDCTRYLCPACAALYLDALWPLPRSPLTPNDWD